MKAFFKKLTNKDKNKDKVPTEEVNDAHLLIEEEKKEEFLPAAMSRCSGEYHTGPKFKCCREMCKTSICLNCAPVPTNNNEILCKLCVISVTNLGN